MSIPLFYGLILLALIGTVIFAVFSRRFSVRNIPTYDQIRLSVDRALETNTALHLSFGSSALRDTSTISAIATASILYYVAARATLADKPTIATMSDPVTLALGQDILWKAYRSRGALYKFRSTLARWYPQGQLSMAFAAGIGTEMLDEDVSANFLFGRFGPELMLATENAIRYNRTVITQSDRIDGLAVAYTVSDSLLMGEELYAASAYLDRTPLHIGGVLTQDLLRFVIIISIIIFAALVFTGAVK